VKQPSLFGLSDHLKLLSANDDPLVELSRIVDFECFLAILYSAFTQLAGKVYSSESLYDRSDTWLVQLSKGLEIACAQKPTS
jgi:hypothetical protein